MSYGKSQRGTRTVTNHKFIKMQHVKSAISVVGLLLNLVKGSKKWAFEMNAIKEFLNLTLNVWKLALDRRCGETQFLRQKPVRIRFIQIMIQKIRITVPGYIRIEFSRISFPIERIQYKNALLVTARVLYKEIRNLSNETKNWNLAVNWWIQIHHNTQCPVRTPKKR